MSCIKHRRLIIEKICKTSRTDRDASALIVDKNWRDETSIIIRSDSTREICSEGIAMHC